MHHLYNTCSLFRMIYPKLPRKEINSANKRNRAFIERKQTVAQQNVIVKTTPVIVDYYFWKFSRKLNKIFTNNQIFNSIYILSLLNAEQKNWLL